MLVVTPHVWKLRMVQPATQHMVNKIWLWAVSSTQSGGILTMCDCAARVIVERLCHALSRIQIWLNTTVSTIPEYHREPTIVIILTTHICQRMQHVWTLRNSVLFSFSRTLTTSLKYLSVRTVNRGAKQLRVCKIDIVSKDINYKEKYRNV